MCSDEPFLVSWRLITSFRISDTTTTTTTTLTIHFVPAYNKHEGKAVFVPLKITYLAERWDVKLDKIKDSENGIIGCFF